MGDTSRVQIYQLPEVTWGVTPASPMKELRFTGESLKHTITTVQSKEIRQDRQITDLVQVNMEANGGFNFELSYGAFDDLIEGLLMASWGSLLTQTAITISAANADNSINDSGAAFPVFVPGQWIKISGFTGGWASAMPAYGQVVSRTASKIVLAGVTVVDDAAGESVTVNGTMIRNGVIRKSFTMEKFFSDITKYVSYAGMVVSQGNMGFAAGEIVTGDFQFMGKAGTAPIGTSVGTGGPTAAPTNPVMNAVSNVATFLEGGIVLAGTFARTLRFGLNNSIRGKPAISIMGNTDIGLGDCVVTGQLSAYFQNETVYNKFFNSSDTSLSIRVKDASNNSYIISMPAVEYTDGNIVAGAANQDVMADMAFQAKRHATYNATIQVDRFAGP